MKKNKRGNIVNIMSDGARKQHMLQLPDLSVASIWSQGAESAHVMLKRRVENALAHGGKLTYVLVMQAVEAYFDEIRNSWIQAR